MLTILPRPGAEKSGAAAPPIPAPSETAFVEAFGSLLPPASYLSTENGRIAYYQLGAKSSAPADHTSPVPRVLFVHGIQTCAIGLYPLISTLSAQFPYAQCVVADLWGHGLTDTPFAAHDAALFHTLLETLMVHLEWPDAHLVGYSFGAVTVASFTAAKPDRVASMVLVAPAGFVRAAQFSETQKGYLQGNVGTEEQALAWILEFLEGGQLVVPLDWKERVNRGEVVAEAVRDWEMKNHKGHAASVVSMIRDGGVFDNDVEFAKAAKTGKKHLCVLGELDDLSSVSDLHGAGMMNVVVVPQAGHSVVRQNVPEVAEQIVDFWNKL